MHNSLFGEKFFDFWLPNEKEKNENSLQAVEDVGDVKDQRIFECPWNDFDGPSDAHDGEQSKVEEESGTEIARTKFVLFVRPNLWRSCLRLVECRRLPASLIIEVSFRTRKIL